MKISDTLVGAGFTGAGALVFAATMTYPPMEGGQPGPALFPRIIAGLMVGFGGLLAARGARARDTTQQVAWRALFQNPGFVNAIFVLAGGAAYIVLADRLGFLLTSSLVMLALMWRLAVRPLTAILVAGALTLAVHALFAKVLRVPLPTGLLWW
jgi:putative tricarboxylic transport membrane protein